MNCLIPIPDSYTFLILGLWCLGSSNLASHVYSRFFVNNTTKPLSIQCIVKALICLAGMLEIAMKSLFSTSILYQLISIPVGLGLGWIIIKIEIMINRLAIKKINKMTLQKNQSQYCKDQGPPRFILSLSKDKNVLYEKTNLKNLHDHYVLHEKNQHPYSLFIILALAVFEEIIFRGYLVYCCNLLPSVFVKAGLIFTVIMFGISHASFGMSQMISKTILGGFCMVVVLIFHTLVPAFIIHGFLNWEAFKNQS